jgi:chemosensory pili system protein ChpA (sensor histidine kinase/response regulator)
MDNSVRLKDFTCMKILLVDDEPFILRTLSVRLNHWGYDVLGAPDGVKGLEVIKQHTPDLLILDKEMPEMTGDEVAKIVRKDDRLKHIPIILISADVENLAESARGCGVPTYLPKPFEPDELRSMITTLLSSKIGGLS